MDFRFETSGLGWANKEAAEVDEEDEMKVDK